MRFRLLRSILSSGSRQRVITNTSVDPFADKKEALSTCTGKAEWNLWPVLVPRASDCLWRGRGSGLWKLPEHYCRLFCSSDSSDEEANHELVGSAEIKKLEDDPELRENQDEEKEGKELAEAMVTDSMTHEAETDSDKEEESVSVMHKVVDADVFLAQEQFIDTRSTAAAPEPHYTNLEAKETESEQTLTESASERRRRLFWDYIENPHKNKHLLNEILSPKSLDEGERFGVDKADMVKTEDFADFLVDVRTSQKAVQSGAILRYRAMMVVGNFQGIVGFGLGKSSTIQGAITRARKLALKNLIAIPLYRQHTIYEASSAKVNKTKVLMWPRSRGFGVVANPLLYGCCDLLGIRDISIKVIGSRNRFNMIKGFFAAVESIQSPIERAEEKGIYLREVCLFQPPQRLRNFD